MPSKSPAQHRGNPLYGDPDEIFEISQDGREWRSRKGDRAIYTDLKDWNGQPMHLMVRNADWSAVARYYEEMRELTREELLASLDRAWIEISNNWAEWPSE